MKHQMMLMMSAIKKTQKKNICSTLYRFHKKKAEKKERKEREIVANIRCQHK